MMEYVLHLAIFISIYSIAGLSLNLIVGYTGIFSITHAVFYAVGSYATAILLTQHGVNFFLTILVGVLIAVVLSLLIGIFLSRFSEDYCAIVSLGFNVIGFAVLINWKGLTRGPFGFPGIGKPSIFDIVLSSKMSFLILSLSILAGVYALCRFLAASSFGRVLKAIRENENAIQVFGYNTFYYKIAIFVIGSVIVSVAGSLFASYLTFINPYMFTINESIFILVIIMLGGLASLGGSVVGALVLVLLPEALRFLGLPTLIAAQMRQVIYGIIIMLLMLFRPQGLIGEYKLQQ
ncbi:MAG: branched-chain amino acid ABC transporter permease [Nitrospirota bacterium]